MPFMKAICVYCGSSDLIKSGYLRAAESLGRAAADRGLQIVYGGGGTGMMGALADGAIGSGGQVIGVIPELFHNPELAHAALTRLEVVGTMHQRKARMIALADAFVALPGGFGTLEELFETLTWAQIGLHQKPIGLLNTAGYFDPLFTWMEQVRAEGFIYAEHQDLFIKETDPELLLDALGVFRRPDGLDRWLHRKPNEGERPDR
jgi:uncharacterized protein (TIGR00730 family)